MSPAPLDEASAEAKALAADLLRKSVSLLEDHLAGREWPEPSDPSALDLALMRADKLDAKLSEEVERRKEAAALASEVFDRALQIALRLAIAGLAGG